MAVLLSRRIRAAGIAAGLLAGTLSVPTVAGATPHTKPISKPTITSVQHQLEKLRLQNDQVVEQYDQANDAYRAASVAADKAASSYRSAALELGAARQQLSATATAQYEGGSFSAAGALLSSDGGASYLDELDTLSMLSSHNAQIVSSYAATQKQATDAKKTANDLYALATANREKLATQRIETQRQIDEYVTLLASLDAEQRAELAKRAEQASLASQARVSQAGPAGQAARTSQGGQSGSQGGTRTVTTKPAQISSAAVRTVVNFALAQVGKPYVWGAAGPGSYDCSGLTMSAYAAAGISLPHSAANQYNYGHHVDAANLQPGDLLFYYQPIGHVSMYIGNGMVVSAPQTGENVKVIPVDTGNGYTGATRLVG